MHDAQNVFTVNQIILSLLMHMRCAYGKALVAMHLGRSCVDQGRSNVVSIAPPSPSGPGGMGCESPSSCEPNFRGPVGRLTCIIWRRKKTCATVTVNLA